MIKRMTNSNQLLINDVFKLQKRIQGLKQENEGALLLVGKLEIDLEKKS